MKIWICGSVSQYGEVENIRGLVKTFKYFDGAFFNVNYEDPHLANSAVAVNETFDLLNLHKKEGKVVWTPWLKRHDWAMNAFLHMVPNNDWFLAIDAQELPKVEFLEKMREFIEDCEKQGIGSVWWNRPYLMKKSIGMEYRMNPHCWPHPLQGKSINIADESKVVYDAGGVHFGDLLYNKKKRENTLLLSAVKYSLYDSPNNQFEMFYKGAELQDHEQKRVNFCKMVESYGHSLDLEGLEIFFYRFKFDKWVTTYLNYEFVFRDFYRYKILNHSLDQILKDRYTYRLEYV